MINLLIAGISQDLIVHQSRKINCAKIGLLDCC